MASDMKRSAEPVAINVRVPSEVEILENPKRGEFLGGGWVDSVDVDMINVYWHKRQELFSLYSLLNVLEHETLHSVLAKRLSLQVSMKLDRVHRSSCICTNGNRLVFINEFKIAGDWIFPPYFEEPTSDLLE